MMHGPIHTKHYIPLSLKHKSPILVDDFNFLVHRKLHDSVLSQYLPYPILPHLPHQTQPILRQLF